MTRTEESYNRATGSDEPSPHLHILFL